jgi:hypothetical protein
MEAGDLCSMEPCVACREGRSPITGPLELALYNVFCDDHGGEGGRSPADARASWARQTSGANRSTAVGCSRYETADDVACSGSQIV